MVGHPATDPPEGGNTLESAIAEGARASLVGVTMSAVLAVAKLGAGIVGNSFALIADGLESTFDVLSGLMVWGGLRVSGSASTAAFPYGRGKAESLAALAVSTMLVTGGVGIAVGAAHEIVIPHAAPAFFTLPFLIGVILVKEGTYRLLSAKGRKLGSNALYSDAWHHRSDAITSLAALVGISIALIGGEGYESADDWAALVACAVILWNGGRLFRSAVRDVLDVAPPAALHDAVRAHADGVPGVMGIDLLRIRKSGLAHFIDIHVEVDPDASVRRGHDIAHHVKDALLASGLAILDVIVHVEPAPPTRGPAGDPRTSDHNGSPD